METIKAPPDSRIRPLHNNKGIHAHLVGQPRKHRQNRAMFRKILDDGEAGDNVGLLLRGVDKKEIKEGSGSRKNGFHYSPHQVQS